MKIEDLRKYSSLSEAQNAMMESGYTEQFDTRDGEIVGLGNKKIYKPEDLLIIMHLRYEGMSNPGDNMILYAIDANDGTKGTMVDNVGGAEPAQSSKIMRKIPMKEEEKGG